MEIISGLGLETELRLGLPGGERNHEKKRVFSDISSSSSGEDNNNNNNNNNINNNKNQVVGWPPVAAFRRKNSFRNKMYVKVSMDGAPFLRKIDLSSHKCYSDLVAAVHELFGSSRIGGDTDDDGKYCEKVPIYEDKDGDWMLLGDVPWEMFIESCKRLRIMKGLDANGIGILQAKDLLKGLAKAEVSN